MTDSSVISSTIEGLRQRIENLENPVLPPSSPAPTPIPAPSTESGDFFRMDNMTMWLSLGAFFLAVFAIWYFTKKDNSKTEKAEEEEDEDEDEDEDETDE